MSSWYGLCGLFGDGSGSSRGIRLRLMRRRARGCLLDPWNRLNAYSRFRLRWSLETEALLAHLGSVVRGQSRPRLLICRSRR